MTTPNGRMSAKIVFCSASSIIPTGTIRDQPSCATGADDQIADASASGL